MLTICIPVYQKIVYPLLNELHSQSLPFDNKVKILAIDDASDAKISEQNKNNIHESIEYLVLKNNIGRSRIRNHFLKHAQTPYLLFIDGDIMIRESNFVARYVHLIENNTISVACGGLIYNPQKPPSKYVLRWKYGHKRETVEVQERRKHPYKSFKTSNFLIKRELLEAIRFNENITSYGHEDTLFGFELKIRQIEIIHINNPVSIENYDTNQQFLNKIDLSISNLAYINQYLESDSRFLNDVKLLNYIYKIKKRNYTLPFRVASFLIRPLIAAALKWGCTSMRCLDMYKLLTAFNSKNHRQFKTKK